MQVHGVKSGIVGASNGGCDAFDINRSLAEGIAEINHDFSETPLASLALGILTLQEPVRKRALQESAEFINNLQI